MSKKSTELQSGSPTTEDQISKSEFVHTKEYLIHELKINEPDPRASAWTKKSQSQVKKF